MLQSQCVSERLNGKKSIGRTEEKGSLLCHETVTLSVQIVYVMGQDSSADTAAGQGLDCRGVRFRFPV
jgi:hypothetical protein